MDKNNIFSQIKGIILNLRYQFFIIFLLFLKYIFKLVYKDRAYTFMSYMQRIIPKFIKNIVSVSQMELKGILLFSTFLLLVFIILVTILSCIYERNKIKKNFFNTKITINLFTNIIITLANIILFIWLINLINGMSLQALFELFTESNMFLSGCSILVIIFIYVLSFYAFFLKEEE